MIWSSRLFMTKGGGGTPAPWEPIQNLIIEGPYRYFRNPMLAGVILFLIAQALIFQSVPIFLWALGFAALNTVYFAFYEEPQLEKRYGKPYAEYKENVPRWLPRLSPY
jgi:protein-S-isoprenylcysteine O-methyltransferase Ste14